MATISTIFQSIIVFGLVSSFSVFFMSLFIVAGIITTKINRNVVERQDEIKNLKSYATVNIGSLVAGGISLAAMALL